jgi:hypothetical protein
MKPRDVSRKVAIYTDFFIRLGLSGDFLKEEESPVHNSKMIQGSGITYTAQYLQNLSTATAHRVIFLIILLGQLSAKENNFWKITIYQENYTIFLIRGID